MVAQIQKDRDIRGGAMALNRKFHAGLLGPDQYTPAGVPNPEEAISWLDVGLVLE